jgi:hypothetical protein
MKNFPHRTFIHLVVIFLIFASLTTLASNGFSRSPIKPNVEERGFIHSPVVRTRPVGVGGSVVKPLPGAMPVAPSQDADFKVEPSQVARGSSHQLTLTSNDCSAKTFGVAENVIDDLQGLKEQHGLDLTNPRVLENDCKFVANLKVSDDAAFDKVTISFHYQEDEADKTATVVVTIVKEEPIPPGPIPPGLPPQVDIMWGVVPQRIVKDNFGTRVGKLFYCIEVVIGNNSGYDLQIASVGFNLGAVGSSARGVKQTIEDAVNDKTTRTQIRNAAVADAQAVSAEAQALRDEALAEIARINCNKARNKKGPCDESRDAAMTAVTSREKAVLARNLAQVERKSADNLINNQLDLVKAEANKAVALSRIAYAQKVPVSSYVITRGSVVHGRIWSTRNVVVNSIKALGPVLTGFIPFFHAVNRRANYSEGVNIFSNPLEKGFEAVFPDETITQLQNLDEGILRDGMIIPNNRQIRTRVFLPKDVLGLKDDLNGRDMRDDPMMVTLALGQMYLEGNKISYLSRVSVTSGPSGEVTPKPVANQNFEREFRLGEGEQQLITITGTFLGEGTLRSDDPKNIKVTQLSNTNTTLTANLEILDTTRLGSHTLTLTTPAGSEPLSITIIQPPPEADLAEAQPTMLARPAKSTSYPVKLTGRFLQGADLVPIEGENGTENLLTTQNVKAAPDGKSATAEIIVPVLAAPGTYRFRVTNEQNRDAKDETLPTIAITLKPPATPGLTSSDPEVNAGPVKKLTEAKTYTITLHGQNLTHAKEVVKADGTAGTDGFVFTDIVPTESGTDLTLHVTVPANKSVGSYTFKLKDADNQVSAESFTIVISPPSKPSLTTPKPEVQDGPIKKRAEAKAYTITLQGHDLSYVKEVVKSGEGTNDFILSNIVVSKGGTVLTLRVTVPANKAAGSYTFKLKDEDNQLSDESFTIDVVAEDQAELILRPLIRRGNRAGIPLGLQVKAE